MRVSTLARCFLLVIAGAAGGCLQTGQPSLDDQDPHQPGEQLGFFAVTGKLADDSCGAESLNAPETWSFQVKLSREGSTLYWLNGREAIIGDIDPSGRFAFETHLDLPLSTPRGAAKGCTIVRRDAANGELDDSASSLNAVLSYAYEATSESDCSEFQSGTSGTPQALPCAMSYALSGARVSE